MERLPSRTEGERENGSEIITRFTMRKRSSSSSCKFEKQSISFLREAPPLVDRMQFDFCAAKRLRNSTSS